MKRGNCRACSGPLVNLSVLTPSDRAATVRLSVQVPGLKRSGEFELCPLCMDSPARADRVQAALMAELQTLLK